MITQRKFDRRAALRDHRPQPRQEQSDPYAPLLALGYEIDQRKRAYGVCLARQLDLPLRWGCDSAAATLAARRTHRYAVSIVAHNNSDLDVWMTVHTLRENPRFRREVRVSPNAEVVFHPAGQMLYPDHPVFAGMPREQVIVEYLQSKGRMLFVDMGGPTSHFDTHGSADNAFEAAICTSDKTGMLLLPFIDDCPWVMPMLTMSSLNDRLGLACADDRNENIRKFLDGMHLMRLKGLLTEPYIGKVILVAIGASEKFCRLTWERHLDAALLQPDGAPALTEDEEIRREVGAIDALCAERGKVFCLDTIGKHLPTEEEERIRAKGRVNEFENNVIRPLVGHRSDEELEERLADFVANVEREQEERAEIIARFPEFVERAMGENELSWQQARQDWGSRFRTEQQGTVTHRRRHPQRASTRTGLPWQLVSSPVFTCLVESDSRSMGALIRSIYNARWKIMLRNELLAEAAKRYPDGVPDEVRAQIEAVVADAKAAVVMLQTRDVERDSMGRITRYRFTVASSNVDLTDVVSTLRPLLAQYSQFGMPVEVEFDSPGGMFLLDGAGEKVQADYFADFRTVFGTAFNSNQLPKTGAPIKTLFEFIGIGLLKGQRRLAALARKEGDRVLDPIAEVVKAVFAEAA